MYSVTVSTKSRIVIGGIITTIAKFLGVEPNPKDQVSRSEQLDQSAFEIISFCKVEASHLCWSYPRDWLMPLPNVDRTTLLHRSNIYWVPGDAEVVQPVPYPPPFTSQVGPSCSFQPPTTDCANLQASLRSIKEEQVSLRAYFASENAALRDFVQELHDELRGCLQPKLNTFRIIRLV